MRMPVTLDELRDCISQINLACPKFGLTTENLPQTVRVYREALEDYDGEAVRGGMRLLLKNITRFPSPSTWRESCSTWCKHNRITLERQPETDSDGNDIVCRICRSVGRWAVLRMEFHPKFSLPMTEPRRREDGTPLAPGETLRRIAVCDPERHHTPHGITSLPANFLRWDS